MNSVITEALENQFNSTTYMLRVLIDVCPEEIWTKMFNGVPFWQQVYHVVWFIDFWMRETFEDGIEWRVMIFDDEYTTDLDAENYNGRFISKTTMAEYLNKIQKKTDKIFDSLNDDKLGIIIEFEASRFTFADIVTTQIRHIMYNIGYLNGILRNLGLPESDWHAYNEPEGS